MEAENELDSTCGISDDELTKRFNKAIQIENETAKAKGAPIARYDAKKQAVYLEYPDGHKEYAKEA